MIFTFLEGLPLQRLLPPLGASGWAAWFGLAALAAWLLWRQARGGWRLARRQWSWFAGLALLTPITMLLVSVRLPASGALPIPALGPPAFGALMPLFMALPWMFGVFVLGPVPGALLAALAGLLLATWDTRSPFTPLEFALLAGVFAAALRQPYQTRFFSLLRNPLAAALLAVVVYPLIYLATVMFWAASDPVAALDFGLSRLPAATVAIALPMLLAAIGLQAIEKRLPANQDAVDARPAPAERSLEARLLFALGPVVFLAFLALGALGWWSAGRTAEQLLGERVRASGELAAETVPFLLETGQNLILQLAGDERLADASPETASALLQTHLNSVPYFEQLLLLDTGGNTIAGYPGADVAILQPAPEEAAAAGLAIQGMSLQFITVAPSVENARSGQLSFIAAVRNDNGQVRGVLIGRTSLSSNPFAQPILQSLQSVNELGGQGLLLDGDGRIILAQTPAAIMQPYNGQRAATALTYEDLAADGSRRFVNYQPATGSAWAVVTEWPARLSQQLALQIALPILLVLLVLALAAFVLLRVSLRTVTRSLQSLVSETRRIASGDLRAPLAARGADEVGRLGAAFESMRVALQARIEENQRLLAVSQGVSSNLDASAHIQPILDAALASGASSARLVFTGADGKNLAGFGRGTAQKAQQSLDSQVHELTRKQARVLLTNPARAQLKAAKGAALPQAVAAFALQSNGEHLGALWLAYDAPQTFAPDAVHYLESLAQQAAKAAVNARLYTSASLGRQRLEAVVHSNPDPLLLLDESQRVVFANAAAQTAFAPQAGSLTGMSIAELIGAQTLQSLLHSADPDPRGGEVQIGRATYRARASLIQDGGQPLGIVLSLQDTSRSKQADTARTDFLSTLSHDLHDPLDLTRGYLNMLGMVGDLNEQQQSYVQKMEHSLENISRLASNLLDIERVSGLKELELQTFALPELIREVCDDLSARARQKRLEFSLQSGQLPLLQADRTLLQRALHNLVDNAVKFSPREGVVNIKTTFVNNRVKIAITDQGSGIAPLDLPRIFENQQGKRKSTGLGIVKSIVERHGGKAWAESELGTGSIFYIELPVQG